MEFVAGENAEPAGGLDHLTERVGIPGETAQRGKSGGLVLVNLREGFEGFFFSHEKAGEEG